MKYRVFGVVMTIFMGIAMGAFTLATPEDSNQRVHQHLISRGPNEGCSCGGAELCTHLPLVVINTDRQEIPGVPSGTDENGQSYYSTTAEGESMLSVHVAVMDDETRNHHPSDTPDLDTSALIRIRGRSSRNFDKHSYLLRFTQNDGTYASHSVMGMDAHYEWALHGPFLDKSLIRNYLWYNIAGEMMEYSPNVRFCEVILNGEYQGLYLMTETITNGEDCRVDISELIDDTTATGYVLRLDQGSQTELKNIKNFTYYTYRISRKNFLNINIEYPRSGALTEDMVLSRKLNDALSSRLFYAHFDSHRDISHFKSSCFCELFF